MKFSNSPGVSFLLWVTVIIHSTIADPQTNLRSDDHGEGEGKIQRLLSMVQDRKLLELAPCDTTLFKIFQEDIIKESDRIIDMFAPVTATDYLKLIFGNKKNYGVEVRKVCASCKEVLLIEPRFKTLYDNPAFENYCGGNAYARDIQHSGLVTYPLGANNTIHSGELPGYIYSRPTKARIDDVPSELVEGEMDILFGILASVAEGLASISPDFMGYGSSTAFRGYIIKDAYPAATLPLWLKLQLHLREETNCKTDLSKSAFYLGYSEGGYASVALADGLKNAIGVQPRHVSAGGGPYGVKDSLIYELVKDEEELNSSNPTDKFLALLLGAAYSSTNSGVPNFNAGQDLLHVQIRNLAVDWLAEKNITKHELNSRLEQHAQKGFGTSSLDDIWNPDILSLVRGAIIDENKNYCQQSYNGYNDTVHGKICEALIKNDVSDILLNADYPVKLCHSPDDELVPYEHVPDVLQNQNLTLVKKAGDHRNAASECLIDGMVFLAQNITTYLPEIQPAPVLEGGCPVGSPTASPTVKSDLDQESLFKNKKGYLKTKKHSFIRKKSKKET